MGNYKDFIGPGDKLRISAAIANAEKQTSGEIRVHLEDHCKGDVMKRAEHHFGKLGMHKTKDRTGILFYVAVKDHQFAIYGDQGINAKVPEHFWNEIRDKMLSYFKEGKFADGICDGINMAGGQLQQHFPAAHKNDNELSNEVSSGS